MLEPLLITMPVTHDQNIDFVALVEATNANLKSYNHIYTYQDFCCKTIYWEIKCWNQKSGFVCGFGDKFGGFHYYARLVLIVLWCCSNIKCPVSTFIAFYHI